MDDQVQSAPLLVRYRGELVRVAPDEDLSFGRASSGPGRVLKLDSSPTDRALSRSAGTFRCSHGTWHVYNASSSLALLVTIDGGAEIELRPGSLAMPLPHGATGTVTVRTGFSYVVGFETPTTGDDLVFIDLDAPDSQTVALHDVFGLTPLELAALTGLCEAMLQDPERGAATVASYQEIGTRRRVIDLSDGEPTKVVEKALERAATKIAERTGYQFPTGPLKRLALAQWAIDRGLVTAREVRWLHRADQG